MHRICYNYNNSHAWLSFLFLCPPYFSDRHFLFTQELKGGTQITGKSGIADHYCLNLFFIFRYSHFIIKRGRCQRFLDQYFSSCHSNEHICWHHNVPCHVGKRGSYLVSGTFMFMCVWRRNSLPFRNIIVHPGFSEVSVLGFCVVFCRLLFVLLAIVCLYWIDSFWLLLREEVMSVYFAIFIFPL